MIGQTDGECLGGDFPVQLVEEASGILSCVLT